MADPTHQFHSRATTRTRAPIRTRIKTRMVAKTWMAAKTRLAATAQAIGFLGEVGPFSTSLSDDASMLGLTCWSIVFKLRNQGKLSRSFCKPKKFRLIRSIRAGQIGISHGSAIRSL